MNPAQTALTNIKRLSAMRNKLYTLIFFVSLAVNVMLIIILNISSTENKEQIRNLRIAHKPSFMKMIWQGSLSQGLEPPKKIRFWTYYTDKNGVEIKHGPCYLLKRTEYSPVTHNLAYEERGNTYYEGNKLDIFTLGWTVQECSFEHNFLHNRVLEQN